MHSSIFLTSMRGKVTIKAMSYFLLQASKTWMRLAETVMDKEPHTSHYVELKNGLCKSLYR